MAPYLSHEGWRKENKPIFSHSGALIKRGTAEQLRRPRLLTGIPNASSLRDVKLSSVLSRRGLRVLAAALSSRPAEVRGHQVSAVRTCEREREGDGKEIRVKAARAVKTAELGGKKKSRAGSGQRLDGQTFTVSSCPVNLRIDCFHRSGSGFIKTVKLSHISSSFPRAASCPYVVEEKHQAPSYLIRGRFLWGPSTGLGTLRVTGNTRDISNRPLFVYLFVYIFEQQHRRPKIMRLMMGNWSNSIL